MDGSQSGNMIWHERAKDYIPLRASSSQFHLSTHKKYSVHHSNSGICIHLLAGQFI